MAAMVLQPTSFFIEKSIGSTMIQQCSIEHIKIHSSTAAKVSTTTATAICLCQIVVSMNRNVPDGSRSCLGQITSTSRIGTCPIRIVGSRQSPYNADPSRLRLDRPDALERLERCDRLRKEFHVYLAPSKIPSKQQFQPEIESLTTFGNSDSEVDEFNQWKMHCNREGIENARKLFWDLGSSQIEEAADVSWTEMISKCKSCLLLHLLSL